MEQQSDEMNESTETVWANRATKNQVNLDHLGRSEKQDLEDQRESKVKCNTVQGKFATHSDGFFALKKAKKQHEVNPGTMTRNTKF